MKTGRNDPCFCNSGKKYKKCCLNIKQDDRIISDSGDEKFSFKHISHLNNTEMALFTTTTNEPFMLIRLYYDIHDKAALVKQLNKLRCIDFQGNDKFLINYIYETENFDLDVKCTGIPKEIQPIILAKVKIIDEKTMVLDLRSFERGWCMIEFLNNYVNREVAEITHIATYNKMHKTTKQDAPNLMNFDYDELFSEENTYRPDVGFSQLMSDAETMSSLKEKQQSMMRFMDKLATEKPVLIEKFPTHFYEDGINSVKLTLRLRQRLAHEHMLGNTSLNMHQLLEKTMR